MAFCRVHTATKAEDVATLLLLNSRRLTDPPTRSMAVLLKKPNPNPNPITLTLILT